MTASRLEDLAALSCILDDSALCEERTVTQAEIELEQAYLDKAHERLDAMRDAARALSAEVVAEGAGGTFAARVERDIRVELSGRRLSQLNIGDGSVCFGRLDFSDGLRAYVGRIGVSDEDGEQLVVDWRAPVAEPFYRATPADPLGVVRRRHFLFRGRRITGIDDELLDHEPPDGLVLMGEGALLAGLERARSGRMHEIVSTIQREQDAIIRSHLAGALVVQGGPGTGKTAVALHRAAYLLFAHRTRLERDGVLLVGPNPVFLRYIEQVLPSLGEHTVALATPGELYVGSARVRAIEPRRLAILKGDARMASLLARAVRTRERPLKAPLVYRYGRHELKLEPAESGRIVLAAQRRRGTHNSRRIVVERLVARALVRAWREAEARYVRVGRRVGLSDAEVARMAAVMQSELREDEGAHAALERMWPVLTPEELLHDLYGAPALLREAGKGLFDAEELESLQRERASSFGEIPWTEADISLLDEAAQLLGPTRRSLCQEETLPTGARHYGHVVVDEAQGVSAMQWRALSRRCPAGSFTIVGDLGQASGPAPPESWEQALQPMRLRSEMRVEELTVNYRTPSEVMKLATSVLAEAAPRLTPPSSVRESGERPLVERVGLDELVGRAVEVARRERQAVDGGRTAVIAPSELLSDLASLLDAPCVVRDDRLSAAEARRVLDAPVAVYSLDTVRGLEFDSVVLVDPSRLVREHEQGLRSLYVALTRTTGRLSVLHAEPLPPSLERARKDETR